KGSARVWNTATGKPVGAELPFKDKLFDAVLSPDGLQVVTLSGDLKTKDGAVKVQLWDAVKAEAVGPELHTEIIVEALEKPVYVLRFSPDNHALLTVA